MRENRGPSKGDASSPVHAVSQKEFMAFQDKILSVITRLKSRVDALTRHVEAWYEKMRQELAVYKVAISARVMATLEGS